MTPWAGILAHNSGKNCNFISIPCCAFTLRGKYTSKLDGKGRYESYIEHLKHLYKEKLFWDVEVDQLRIPSTKNICFVGRKRTFDKDHSLEWQFADNHIKDLIADIQVTLRISDKEKQIKLFSKRAERLKQIEEREKNNRTEVEDKVADGDLEDKTLSESRNLIRNCLLS